MTTQTLTLSEFLEARIAEDERGASAFAVEFPTWAGRLAAQCAAHRRIVEWATDEYADDYEREKVLPILASAHATHPDYREEWGAKPAHLSHYATRRGGVACGAVHPGRLSTTSWENVNCRACEERRP